MSQTNLQIKFHDKGPDRLDRRAYTLMWDDPDGVYRKNPSPRDGEPVGYRRGQCFFSKQWEALLDGGAEVVT